MNYKKKIQEIQTEINIINKYYINQVANPSKETINNRVEYINRVMNLLEKPTNLNQLKYLLKVIQIELDQL